MARSSFSRSFSLVSYSTVLLLSCAVSLTLPVLSLTSLTQHPLANGTGIPPSHSFLPSSRTLHAVSLLLSG